jgi:Protein of unknown function (DUF1320)
MAIKLSAPNYEEPNLLAFTSILSTIEAGVSHFPVENTASFVAQKTIAIGRGENAEVLLIQSVSPQEIVTTTNSRFRHTDEEPVYCLLGNKVRFYSSPNLDNFPPANNTYTLIDGGEVAIVPDQLETVFVDPDGSSDFWYKFIYFDSNSNDYTDLEDSIASRGDDFGHFVDVNEVRDEAGFKESIYIMNTVVLKRRNEAESEIKGVCASAGYALPLRDSKGNLYVPEVIEQICRNLAAGFLLTKEYGASSPDTKDQGLSKIKNARETLKLIANSTLILLGPDDVSLSQQSQVEGSPDDDTDETGEISQPSDPKFTMGQVF